MNVVSSRQLSVLMLSPQFRPLVGGYERAAERLSGALAEAGLRVVVITERRDLAWTAVEYVDGYEVRRLPCLYRPRLHLVTSLLSFSGFLLCHGRQFDIWHVHQYGLHAALAIALGKVMRRPVVLKLTNSGNQGVARVIEETRFSSFSKMLLRKVTAVVALTRETAIEAMDFGIPPGRIHRLGNGVDTTVFRPHGEVTRNILKVKLGIGPYRTAIYVGRLSEEKNPVGLIEAWIKAFPLMPGEWKLVFVGDGKLRNFIEDIVARQCPDGRVLLLGQRDNIDEWMGSSDIYVNSSHNEGLSNTLLEAMASALPVVATRVSGVAELVSEPGAGLVADAGDMDGVANALVRLACDDALRKKMGLVGRQLIEERFSIGAVAQRYEAVYRQLIAGKAA